MKRLAVLTAMVLCLGIVVVSVGNLPVRSIRSIDPPVVRASGGGIVGAWINAVSVNTGGAPLVFPEFISVNPGGTFLDTLAIAHSSQNPFFTGPFAPLAVDFSDAFGVWQSVGNSSNRFAFTFNRMIFAGADTPTSAYGTFFPGQYVGVASIQAVGNLQHNQSGDTLSGPFTFQLSNLSGQVVLAASGTFSATRMAIQPLATN